MKKGILVLIAVGLTVLSCKKAEAPVQENHNDSIVVDTIQVEEGDSVTIDLDTVN